MVKIQLRMFMEKDIFLFKIIDKVKKLTSVDKILIVNTISFLIFLIVFNIITVLTLKYFLVNNIETRLFHEMDRVKKTLYYNKGELKIVSEVELRERDFQELTIHPFFLQVYDTKGNVLLISNNLNMIDELPIFQSDELNKLSRFTVKENEYYYIVDSLKDSHNSQNNLFIRLSTYFNEEGNIIKNLLYLNFIFLIIFFILNSYINRYLNNRFLKPLYEIIQRAHLITFSKKNTLLQIPEKSTHEINTLINTLNELISRSEYYIDQMSRFTDNSAHQLLTPLTGLKAEIEFLIKKDRTTEEYKKSLEVLNHQTEKLIKIVKTLLLISKIENTENETNKIINASEVILKELDDSPHRNLIKSEIEEDIFLRGVDEYFSLIVQNLIDNALKFSNYEEQVVVKFLSNENYVFLIVEDQGIGIMPEDKEKIFERFYRSKVCENLGIDGSGLGLCLVKTLVRNMQGELFIEDNIPHGTIIKIKFPKIILS